MLCITQVIFAHQSVLCCPAVLLFGVLAVHLGNCSTSCCQLPIDGCFCPNSGYIQVFHVHVFFYINSEQSTCKTSHCFIVPAFINIADQVSCNIKARKVVYLMWQLCLRESEGRSKTQLLIMDICPRYQRPEFRSQTGMLAPILFHIGHKSSDLLTCCL